MHPTHRAAPWLALAILGLAVAPASAQTTEELGRRWADQRARQDAIDEQHRRDIDRSFREGELFRQRQEQQRRLDELQVDRQRLLNEQLHQQNQLMPYGYAPPPGYAYPPGYSAPPAYGYAPQPACQQYAQAYDPAGRPLGLVCVR